RLIHRLEDGQVGLLRCGRGGVRVVGQVGVELVAVVDGRRVGLRAGGGHLRGDGQGLRGAGVDRADGPDAAGAAVTALAGGGGDEGDARWQHVPDGDAGGRVGAGVAQGNREGDGVADVGGGVADRLGDLQVGLLRGLGGSGRVVAGVGVELV